MNTKYWTKPALYAAIDRLKLLLGVSTSVLPIQSKELAYTCTRNLTIEELPFPSDKICGILYRGNTSTSIALNSNRTPQMQNFDCMHELVHYFFHDIQYCQRICCDEKGDNGKIEQDIYIEWQANEGAAQFLVPYQDFIPRFLEQIDFSRRWAPINIERSLADFYGVTTTVIHNRLDSLSYEIDQYRLGVSMAEVEVLSKKQRERRNIVCTCYQALCSFPLNWNSEIGVPQHAII